MVRHSGKIAALALVATLGICVARAAAQQPAMVGVDLPLLTSPFWQAYDRYIVKDARAMGIDMLAPVNSNYDTAQQITDMRAFMNGGASGIVTTPVDSAAVGTVLNEAARRGVQVVATDVAPAIGKVFMVVRADNRAYGEMACKYIGDHLREGKVVQIMGDLASVNGRDRTTAFRDCMKRYPAMTVLEIPTCWRADAAAAGLDGLLTSNPDIKAIYMQAGGSFLAPTLQTLRRRHALHPAGAPGHIVIVSNDGIRQEYDAIRKGLIDATVAQPADLYAKYGLYYMKAAFAGRHFKPGPTDHASRIVTVSGGNLEDELPARLVTRANVDDTALWGNQP